MLQGRSSEIHKLNEFFERKESNIVILYGYEYAGISSLWREFAKGKDAVYLSAVPATEREQAYLWAKHLNWDEKIPIDYSYKTVFHSVISAKDPHKPDKKLLIIDQFHYLCSKENTFFEELHDFMDVSDGEDSCMFLLMSHHVNYVENTFSSWMRDYHLKPAGYLYVAPLHFIDMVCMMNTQDFDKLLSFYSILGGFSDAYQSFTPGLSLKQNIIGNFLLPNGIFRNYGLDIIKEELREPAVYASILAALADGKNKLNDLFEHLGFSRAKISVYLKNLSNLGLVKKRRSFDTPGAENTQKGVYVIANPMVSFYYTYIYPNETLLYLSNTSADPAFREEVFYDTYIAPSIETYCMKVFSLICEEFLLLADERDLLPIKITSYGNWVGKSGPVDVIAQNAERDFLFAFCNPKRGVYTLEEYKKALLIARETHLSYDYLYLFSLDGFEERLLNEVSDLDSVYLFDRSDLS